MQNITVVEPATALDTRWQTIPVEAMEEQAIGNNADLRESFYNARIASQETRRALLKLFPGLSFNYGVNHSDDDYLINQNWNAAGIQLSFNLLGLLSAFATMVAFAILSVLGARLAWDDFQYEVTSPGIGVPQWWYTVTMPLLCIVITWRAIEHFIVVWKDR